jgi:hypothetical protein
VHFKKPENVSTFWQIIISKGSRLAVLAVLCSVSGFKTPKSRSIGQSLPDFDKRRFSEFQKFCHKCHVDQSGKNLARHH